MYNHQLDAFLKAADLHSFSKAARELYIAPASLIQQINLLEKHLDVKLFNRSSKGVTLTPAGEAFYLGAKEIIQVSENAVNQVRKIGRNFNNLHIGTSLMTKCRYLIDACTHFITIYPDTQIELVSLDNPAIANKKPLDGLGTTYDLFEGLYLSYFYDGKCNYFELCQTPLSLSCSKEHHLYNSKTVSINDLSGETVVYLRKGISKESDIARLELEKNKEIHILDVDFFDVNIYTMCEYNNYVLISADILSDVHPGLYSIPIDWQYTLPYGVIYSKKSTAFINRFINTLTEINKSID